jgi:hypothetical protein
MLLRPRLGLALLALVIVTKLAIAQEPQQKGTIPSLLKPADAVARMNAEQARETEAYTLGVQTVLWGCNGSRWVKPCASLRHRCRKEQSAPSLIPAHMASTSGDMRRRCSRMSSAS